MPKIPTSQRQVREQSFSGQTLSTKQTTPISGPQGAGQIAKIGSQIGKYIDGERKKAEFADLGNFKNEARNEYLKYTVDKDNGFMAKERGKNAGLNREGYETGYQTFLDEKISKMGTESLRSQASQIANQFKTNLNGDYTKHQAKENENYLDGQTNASLKSIADYGAANYKDVNKVGFSMTEQALEVENYAKRKGLSPQETRQMKLRSSDQFHDNIITRALTENQDQYAEQYLKTFADSGQISGGALAKLESRVRAGTIKGESVRQSESILDLGLGLEESKKKAREITDPDVMDATVRRVDNQIRERRAEDKYVKRQYYEGLGDVMFADPASFELTDEMNEKLTLAEQRSLMSLKHKMLLEKTGGSKRKESDWGVYDKLNTMTHDELQKTDVLKYTNDLVGTDIKKFLDMKKDAGAYENSQTEHSYISSLVKGQELEANSEEANYLRTLFTNELNRYPKDERLKPDTLNKVRSDLLLQVKEPWGPGNIFGGKQKYYEARSKGTEKIEPANFFGSSTRPDNVPAGSNFVDKIVDGIHVLGYEKVDESTGITIYYDHKGNPLRRKQLRKR